MHRREPRKAGEVGALPHRALRRALLLAGRDELQELSELGKGQCGFPNQKTPLGSPGYVCQPWNSKQEQVLGFKLLFPLECVLELSDAGCKKHRGKL